MATNNDAFHGALVEEVGAVRNEYFRCKCGHEWSREMCDGLVAIGCPICGAEHLTNLGRMFFRLVNPAT
jgi:hypothetical protein